jgi:PAS domain-containing protein
MTIAQFALLAGAALPVSVAVIWCLGVLPVPRKAPSVAPRPAECHFLFRGDTLVDHDAGALTDTAANDPVLSDWDRVRDWLGFRFPDMPKFPEDILPGAPRRFQSRLKGDRAYLDAQASRTGLRLRLSEDPPPSAGDLHEIRRAYHAADAARQAIRDAPYPAWISDEAGGTVWQNTAAVALPEADKACLTDGLTPSPDSGETVTRRIAAPVGGATAPETWFDVTIRRRSDGHLVFANDVTALVAAETAQRDFVQTLGKTFADLPTGLAVFDRAKTLAMFNPALIDLTGLPVEFLSTRPEIVTFFDMLRDRQVMPEPKNYASWRSQINDMVSAAHGGHYREMWSLANGRSYRVTGRPHPDGAVAFLFEDITLEISETRHHRGEMALRDALLDHLDEAIAVVSSDRRVILCNRAFGDLVALAPDRALTDLSLSDVMQACQARFPDPTLWSEIERRVTSNALRDPISGSISADGPDARLDLRLAPLGQGRAMLSMHRHDPGIAPPARQRTA